MIRSAGSAAADPPSRRRFTRLLSDQYGALTSALFGSWAELGVEVTVATSNMAEYLDFLERDVGIDLFVGAGSRTTTTRTISRSLCSTRATAGCAVLLLARDGPDPGGGAAREPVRRAGEPLPRVREPDARIRSPRAALPRRRLPDRGTVGPRTPASQHGALHQLHRGRQDRPRPRRPRRARAAGGGVSQVPIAGVLRSWIPQGREHRREGGRALPNVFDTADAAKSRRRRSCPGSRPKSTVENEGLRYRFRLRPGIRFHDGRPLTARDVRHSLRAPARWTRRATPMDARAHPRSEAAPGR